MVATRKMLRSRGGIPPALRGLQSQYEKTAGYYSRDLVAITRSRILSWRDILKITLSKFASAGWKEIVEVRGIAGLK